MQGHRFAFDIGGDMNPTPQKAYGVSFFHSMFKRQSLHNYYFGNQQHQHQSAGYQRDSSPKMKNLSFTHAVVPNLYVCLCSAEHKGRYSEGCGKQSSSGAPLTSIVFVFPTIEVNGAPKQPDYKLSSKYLLLCSAEQRNSYRFGTTWSDSMISNAKSETARPGARLNGFKNGKTQLFDSRGVVKWGYFQKSEVFFNIWCYYLMILF